MLSFLNSLIKWVRPDSKHTCVTGGVTTMVDAEICVSVIVPVYNVDEYLRQCLASVASQSLENIEVICIDDCSTDKSGLILKEYADDNPAFKIYYHQHNRGLSAARNTGLDKARGIYVYFLDSDDYLASEDALSILYNTACEDDADEVVGGIIHWNEYTNDRALDWDENYLKKEVRRQTLAQLPQLTCNVIAVNKLIRKSLIDCESVRFIEGLRKYEDNPFSCKMHILARSISILPVTTYIYRKGRAGSIMMNEVKEDAEYKNIYCAEIFGFIESRDEYHKYREMYYMRYIRQLILGAVTLSHFSPSEDEKSSLLQQWALILSVMPVDLPGVPERFQNILRPVLQGRYELAWEKILAWDEAVRQSN
jgi:glycosyltransferase involved in cell wall biosynthesis